MYTHNKMTCHKSSWTLVHVSATNHHREGYVNTKKYIILAHQCANVICFLVLCLPDGYLSLRLVGVSKFTYNLNFIMCLCWCRQMTTKWMHGMNNNKFTKRHSGSRNEACKLYQLIYDQLQTRQRYRYKAKYSANE